MHRRQFLPVAAASAAGLTVAASAAAQQPQRQRPARPLNEAQPGQAQRGARMASARPQVTKAVCVLMPVGDSGVSGLLTFEQVEGRKVKVTGEVKGLTPGDHGFHVHQFGDLTNLQDGTSAGGHMDVGEHKHGKPTDEDRHTGDLGNITADESGVAKVDMTDTVISLNGPNSILGRGFIVHADADDFGQPTGNAGARVAIGVIGIAKDGLK
ncbi:superoxide dismutase family protein [Alienimonas californiensis]|uniref:Superoxide dismutase [Cu-Zn] n=1 Tax=Alienimonas californiensis TaxID=2527989 RepID=A0A517P8I8_9PLAN|nr:superoxide dismutase family protein [Alienimonas californiensis]QDT15684.1 Superoxide dismutase [Cu-Zn] precursor [Alienimonas californiensis]